MAKKATAKTTKATQPNASIFEQMSLLIGDQGQLLDDRALAHRSPGGREHLNQAFDINAYDVQRPAEADPKTWEGIFTVCDNWYQKNGLIRNIIDLMADFCVAGIQISSTNMGEQAVLRKWFEKVDGLHVSERIANMLYRLGNVGVRKQHAKVKIDLRKRWQEISAETKVEIKIPDHIKDETVLPYKYVTIGPKHIKVPRPEVAAFLTEPYYCLKIKKDLQWISRLDNDIDNEELMKLIPEDIREALTSGNTVRLDNDTFKMLNYKKDDFDKSYSFPLIYAALSDLTLWSKMQLADRNIVDSASKHVVFVKVGDPKGVVMPTIEYMEDLAQKVNKAGTGGSKSYVITHPFIELVSDPGTLAAFLGKAKFENVIESIHATFGTPAALTGTASGTAANNFMQVKVLIKKLEYVRQILQKFWNDEIKHVHASCGLKAPFFITFAYQELGDEAAIKKLIQDMYDREVLSDESYRYMMGVNHELEESRISREREERQRQARPPKAGPFHTGANFVTDAMKIAIQGGSYTPEDFGINLEDNRIDPQIRKPRLEVQNELAIKLAEKTAKLDMDKAEKQIELDIRYENEIPQPVTTTTETPTTKITKKSVRKVGTKPGSKKATKKPKGVPGTGRPKNSSDKTKRKQRTMRAPNKT